jgi:CO/xanthine dehydrogenase Mo-binding subunit
MPNAVASALSRAVGYDFDSLPLTAEALWKAAGGLNA